MILGVGQVIKNADTICNRQGIKEWRQKEGEKGKEKGEGAWMHEKEKECIGSGRDVPLHHPPSSLQCLDVCHANWNSAGDRV